MWLDSQLNLSIIFFHLEEDAVDGSESDGDLGSGAIAAIVIIILIVVGAVVAVTAVVVIFLYYKRKQDAQGKGKSYGSSLTIYTVTEFSA